MCKELLLDPLGQVVELQARCAKVGGELLETDLLCSPTPPFRDPMVIITSWSSRLARTLFRRHPLCRGCQTTQQPTWAARPSRVGCPAFSCWPDQLLAPDAEEVALTPLPMIMRSTPLAESRLLSSAKSAAT